VSEAVYVELHTAESVSAQLKNYSWHTFRLRMRSRFQLSALNEPWGWYSMQFMKLASESTSNARCAGVEPASAGDAMATRYSFGATLGSGLTHQTISTTNVWNPWNHNWPNSKRWWLKMELQQLNKTTCEKFLIVRKVRRGWERTSKVSVMARRNFP